MWPPSGGTASPPGRRLRSARNALAHGLYTAAVVPAAGESPEALAELCAAVRRELRPRGAIAGRLADRVALVLLRFDHVARFEAATANGAATAPALPPDPDTITGDGIDICVSPCPESPPAFRLAFARARLAGWVPVRAAFRAAVAALAGEPEPDVTVPGRSARRVVFEIGAALGWDRDEACERWVTAAGSPDDPIAGDRFRKAVRALAVVAGRSPNEGEGVVREHLAARGAEYHSPIAEREAEVAALTAELREAREQVMSAAVYADATAADTVMRMEAHLTRQLGLTLDLLDRLQSDRAGGGRAGFTGLFRGLGGGASPSLIVRPGGFVS